MSVYVQLLEIDGNITSKTGSGTADIETCSPLRAHFKCLFSLAIPLIVLATTFKNGYGQPERVAMSLV
jgi:hypothetical protein